MGIKWYHLAALVGVVLAMLFLAMPRDREWGLLLDRSDRYGEADAYLRQVLADNPADPLVVDAMVTRSLGGDRGGEAADILNRYLAVKPEDFARRERLVGVMLAANDVDGAVGILNRGPPSPAAHRRLAEIYEQTGDMALAATEMRKLLTRSDSDLPVLERIVELEGWGNNVDGKIAALEDIAARNHSPKALIELLQIYVWRDDIEHGKHAAAAVERIAQLDSETLRSVLRVYFRAGDQPAALRVAARLSRLPEATPEDWLDLKRLHEWNHDKPAMIATLERAIVSFPRSEMLLREIASETYAQGRFPDAEKWSTKVAQLTGAEADWRQVAFIDDDLGRLEEGRKALAPFIKAGKASILTIYLDGSLAMRAGVVADARARAEQLVLLAEAKPADSELMRFAADLARQVGDSALRTRILEALVRSDATTPDQVLELARTYIEVGKPEEALALLGRLKDMPGHDAVSLHKETARARLEVVWRTAPGDPGLNAARIAALTAIEAVLADGEDVQLRIQLVHFALDTEGAEKALKALEAIANPPVDLLIGVAVAYAEKGNGKLALGILARVPADAALSHGDIASIGRVHLLANDPDGAVKYYERALALAPESDPYLVSLADAWGATGDHAKQYTLLGQRLEKFGLRAWFDLADRYRWNNDAAGEELVLSRAREKLGDIHELLARHLLALHGLSRFADAVAVWKLLATDPDRLDTAQVLAAADSLASIDDLDGSEALYKRLVGRRSDDPEALNGLARITARQGRNASAIALFRRYLALRPEDGWGWYDLGELIHNNGGDGRKELIQADRLLPNDRRPEHLAAHAHCQRRQGRIDQSIKLYDLAIAAGANLQVACDFSSLLIEADLLDHAAAVIDKFAAQGRDNPRLQWMNALVMAGKGDRETAVAVLRRLHDADPTNAGLLADLASAEDAAGHWMTALRTYDQVAAISSRRDPLAASLRGKQ